jgi:hypothetical protein
LASIPHSELASGDLQYRVELHRGTAPKCPQTPTYNILSRIKTSHIGKLPSVSIPPHQNPDSPRTPRAHLKIIRCTICRCSLTLGSKKPTPGYRTLDYYDRGLSTIKIKDCTERVSHISLKYNSNAPRFLLTRRHFTCRRFFTIYRPHLAGHVRYSSI